MKFLSFLEYQTEKNISELTRKLSDIGIPKKQFVQAALEIAKSVQHLVAEHLQDSAILCLETTEKYLRGEATKEDCRKVVDAICAVDEGEDIVQSEVDVYAIAAANHAYEAAYAGVAAAAASNHAMTSSGKSYAASAADIAYHAAFALTVTSNIAYPSVYAGRVACFNAAINRTTKLLREHLPWDLVCGFQVAGVLNRIKDEEFVWQVSKNQKMVSYATMILSESSMHKNFKFFMTEFLERSK